MENQKPNEILYSKCGFTIQLISRQYDRIEIFKALADEKIGDKIMHPLKRLEVRESLKTKTRWLYSNLKNTTYVIRKNGEYVGFAATIVEEGEVPIADHIYLVPKFRKTKAIACIIDFGMNYLFKDVNIKIDSQLVPGFKKICLDGTKLDSFWVVYRDTADRVKKICEKCKG